MKQILKPSERAQKATYESSEDYPESYKKSGYIVGKFKPGRSDYRLKRADGAGTCGSRTGVAVQSRNTYGFRIALIDFSFEKIGKMDVGKQRGSSLYPSSQVF